SVAHSIRATILRGRHDLRAAENEALEALAVGHSFPEAVIRALGVLAGIAGDGESHAEAARLFGAEQNLRHRCEFALMAVHRAPYEADLARTRDAMGDAAFETAR